MKISYIDLSSCYMDIKFSPYFTESLDPSLYIFKKFYNTDPNLENIDIKIRENFQICLWKYDIDIPGFKFEKLLKILLFLKRFSEKLSFEYFVLVNFT